MDAVVDFGEEDAFIVRGMTINALSKQLTAALGGTEQRRQQGRLPLTAPTGPVP